MNPETTALADPRHCQFPVQVRAEDRFDVLLHGNARIRFSAHGRHAAIESNGNRVFRAVDLLRWGAPLGLLPFGRVCLHAAACMRSGRVVALLGPGGAGKSTTVREMVRLGWRSVADDLLMLFPGLRVDPRIEGRFRAWCVDRTCAAGGTIETVDYGDLEALIRAHGQVTADTLAAIVCLTPERIAAERFAFRRLHGTAALDRLVSRGYGSPTCAYAWRTQLECYAMICERVTVVDASAPAGLRAMRAALPAFIDELEGL